MKRSLRLLALTLLAIAVSARAATFTVRTAADDGPDSFRQVILDANAEPGFSQIHFDIPPAGPHTIHPSTALPEITANVLIDGRTQPGYAGQPLVGIDGWGCAPPASGLTLVGGNSLVFSLSITSFPNHGMVLRGGTNVIAGNFVGLLTDGLGSGNRGDGLFITGVSRKNIIGGTNSADRNIISTNHGNGIRIEGTGADANRIQGNYIGTTQDGSLSQGNGLSGVLIVNSPGHIIGGNASPSRNVISGNQCRDWMAGLHQPAGVSLAGPQTRDCRIEGNYIGTDVTGTAEIGNRHSGISLLAAQGNRIGGALAGEGNLLSGNRVHGLLISGAQGEAACSNIIRGNFVGPDASGVTPLGNGQDGIAGFGLTHDNVIGGEGPWPTGNTITFNGGNGVSLGANNPKLGNSILRNGLLGLGYFGGTPWRNDYPDRDGVQNYPVITRARAFAEATDFVIYFESRPESTYRIEIFLNADCDPSGFGEGDSLLLALGVTTDTRGENSFRVTFPFSLPVGQFITATATSEEGDTSEFSPCVPVQEGRSPLIVSFVPGRYSLVETGGLFTCHITRETSGVELSVRVDTTSGSAKAAEDFVPLSTLVTFKKDQTRAQFDVTVLDDALPEGPEDICLELSNPVKSDEVWDRVHLTILDDDARPALLVCRESDQTVIAWPAIFPNYTLQHTFHPEDPKSWIGWKEPIVPLGNQNMTMIPKPGSAEFFRLIRKIE